MNEKILKKIAHLMKKHHLTTDEVIAFLQSSTAAVSQELSAPLNSDNLELCQFDLLCSVGWNMKRVPWQEGVYNNPRGLFPFKDDNRYLALQNVDSVISRAYVVKNCLPTIDFFKKISPLLPQINEAMAKLHQPELSGCYYARANELDSKNWIVTFDSSASGLQYCCHEDSMMAKVRYVQEFCE